MGEFDDVLAMEPGDEWDDYDPTDHSGPAVVLPELVAELRVPGAVVELRGEVPEAALEALDTLRAPCLGSGAPPVVVAMSVRPDGDGHALEDHDRGEVAGPLAVDELVARVANRLAELAGRDEARQVVLPVAAVQLPDGRGALVVDPEDGRRHRIVAALVARGAGLVGADRVVVVPGSRTVLAVPTPLRGPHTPLTAEQVAPATTASLLLVPEQGDGSVERLARANGCARLLVQSLAVAPDRHELVRVVATMVAACSVRSVPVPVDPDDDELAGAVNGLEGPSTHELVGLRRPWREHPELVVVRFRHGGVLVDTDRTLAFELDESELPTVDAVRWPVVAADPDRDAEVLVQLAAAGIDLRPVAGAGLVRAPGPESYGLPDAPTGRAASALWDGPALTRAAADPCLAPVLLHAARRHEIRPDDDVSAQLDAQAAAVAARRVAVEGVLERALAAAAHLGIEPLVLGASVLAQDGPLPAELVEVDRVDLLMADEEVSRLAEALVDAGAVVGGPGPDPDDPDAASPPTTLVVDGTVEVVLRSRLAAGPFGELVDHDDLVERSVPCRIGPRWARSLHPDDRFVWACVRVGQLAAPTTRDLREVVLDAPGSRAGMAAALEASARWGATRTVLAAIRAVDLRLPGLSPWLVERATRPAPAPERRRRRGSRRR